MIAWASEDRPTDAQIGMALDEFERAAWAGLEPARYCWSAVLHREEGGGCHAHVLAARVDLGTGKSLNIAPPGHRRLFDALAAVRNRGAGLKELAQKARAGYGARHKRAFGFRGQTSEPADRRSPHQRKSRAGRQIANIPA